MSIAMKYTQKLLPILKTNFRGTLELCPGRAHNREASDILGVRIFSRMMGTNLRVSNFSKSGRSAVVNQCDKSIIRFRRFYVLF